ncbi:TetR/AcrR family transcriptional regulator [Leucobacter japonicus]|uniref:TetR/AcrR family transcriptional regulator n=1 Tax=Leucobacter japonicus TaxID=1461259 RepID=UPI0006A7C4A1|nr:hypothetical protein [Leucobacter japonicus]
MASEEKVLAVSRACIEAFLDAGTLDIGVAELCGMTGISARSFHRYFPTKPQLIRPFFDEMTRTFGERIIDSPLPFEAAAREAFRVAVLGSFPGRIVDFMRLLRTREEYWAVFLEVADASERTHSATLARRLPGLDDDALVVVTAGVVASSRLALIAGFDGADPEPKFAAYLHRFMSGYAITD